MGDRRRRWLLVCPLLLLVLLVRVSRGDSPHTFEFKPDGKIKATSVDVAGSFNNWSATANALSQRDDGTWAATLTLPDGIYFYKFVVNGDQWISDTTHSDKEMEEHDGYNNSAVLIGPDARKAPPAQPNHINRELVLYDPASATDLNVVDTHTLRVRVRAQAGDVEKVEFASHDVATNKTFATQLHRMKSEMGFDVFAGIVQTSGEKLQYELRLIDGSDTYSLESPKFNVEMAPTFTTPDWAKHAVWYQIFPERFRNGDPSNDPEHTQKWQSKWFSSLPGEAPGMENFYKGKGNIWWRRYGGDVQGLIQELGYLKSLGVTAIYLNPMFKAESMHKYDTADYRHIDDTFGFKGDLAEVSSETDDPATWQWTRSDKLFLDFVDQVHKQGFKVILDGVFNHVGRQFWAFQDVMKNGKASKYADWFDVRDWNAPIKYIAWDRGDKPSNDGALPVFKKDEKLGLVHGPREHVLAIAKRWLAPDGDASKGVDGFRLDVPGDIPHPFWVEFRNVVKSVKPDAYISGEIWQWAQPWLKGDQFDAVMNYQFAETAQAFFVDVKKAQPPSRFAQRCNELVLHYPLQVSLAQMNLFDSHDTDRLASMFVNPDLTYDATNRIQDNGPNYNPAKPNEEQWKRMKQAVAFQMTFLGAPMIYYGDEAGMWGPDDPSNRQPMIWKDLEPYDDPEVAFRQDLFEAYQRMIAVRNTLPALQTGFFRAIVTDDSNGIFAFARQINGSAVYVALNRSGKAQTITLPIDVPGLYVNYLDPEQTSVVNSTEPQGRSTIAIRSGAKRTATLGKLTIELGPYESAVLAK